MDKITKSLQAYLKSARIPYKTMFNTEGGSAEGESTSTIIHIQNSDDDEQIIDMAINVYPKDGNFNIDAFPRYVFTKKSIGKILTLQNKWNRSGMFTSLVIEEEDGIVNPDCYRFHNLLQGIIDPSGQSECLWSRYIKKVEEETWLARDKIVAAICLPKVPF